MGRSWENIGKPHLWTFGTFPYAHTKIPKPEVKGPDAKLHAQKFRNQRYHLRKRIHAKILKPEVHVKIPKPDLHKNLETTPVKNPETRGGKIFKKISFTLLTK